MESARSVEVTLRRLRTARYRDAGFSRAVDVVQVGEQHIGCGEPGYFQRKVRGRLELRRTRARVAGEETPALYQLDLIVPGGRQAERDAAGS